MRKIATLLILLLVAVAGVHAQNDKKAQEVLDQFSKKYNSYKTIKADFKLILENKARNYKEEKTGTLYLKDGMFKVNMPEYDIISDNKSVWTYMKEINEVQITEYNPEQLEINPNDIFTMYKNGFLYGYAGEETINNRTYHIIDLTPTDKSKSYFKVRLKIDKATGDLYESKIFENQEGKTFTYRITNLKPNTSMDAAVFTFNEDKHPGVIVSDLR